MNKQTVWVFGDQLNQKIGALGDAKPTTHRILIIESGAKITTRRWHVQRAHFIVASMRRFADELREAGFEVDYRFAESMRAGVQLHYDEYAPSQIVVTEPNSFAARELVSALGLQYKSQFDLQSVKSNQFLCHPDEYANFRATRKTVKMEDFYRWQRTRLDVMMEGDDPVGGKWNFDEENRQGPPKTDQDRWPKPKPVALDALDAEVIADVSSNSWGQPPTGQWATTRTEALVRMKYFMKNNLPLFGEHEDAMLKSNWHLAHSLLSPYLNLGLLLPGEIIAAAVKEFEAGKVPINCAEGFIRQIIGWREYIWNCYWQWMPKYAEMNSLNARRDLPKLFTNPDATSMSCMKSALNSVYQRSYAHHIERLMVLGNFALIAGVNPQQLNNWMWNSFVDAAEWVMVPNVIGMSQYADGGMLATKPYASGGAYIDRMSDHCKGCRYDRKQRVGPDACPFTVLYWDFFLRHEKVFAKNPRVARQVHAAQQLSDHEIVRETAVSILSRLDQGVL